MASLIESPAPQESPNKLNHKILKNFMIIQLLIYAS